MKNKNDWCKNERGTKIIRTSLVPEEGFEPPTHGL